MKLPYFGLNIRLLFTDFFQIRFRIWDTNPVSNLDSNLDWGSPNPNSDDRRKSLALGLLCAAVIIKLNTAIGARNLVGIGSSYWPTSLLNSRLGSWN
jgi:hypothetical protein